MTTEELMRKTADGLLSKRDVIKYAGILGVGQATMKLLLAAHERARLIGEERSNGVLAENNVRVLAARKSQP